MAIRDSKELGSNLIKIAKRLLENQRLCKLLKNTDLDPFIHDDFADTLPLLHQNVLVVPKVNEDENNTESKIAVVYTTGKVDSGNIEFKNLRISVFIYIPLTEWIINDENLRPFLIMSEIEQSLKNKRINGIGVMKYNGFDLNLLTNTMSCYKMEFDIDVFN